MLGFAMTVPDRVHCRSVGVVFLLCLLLHLGYSCPVQCQCTPVPTGGERVVCPSGQSSLPAGLDPNTKTLIMTGRPTPQGNNNIPVLRHADLTSLPALEELSLPFANLVDLQDDVFGSSGNLKRLSLHNNKIQTLTPRTFAGLSSLDYLDLTDNEGCVLQGDVFGQLKTLKTLYLGGLGLRKVKSLWFKSLSQLESLDLHGNQIDSLEPDFLQGLLKLKSLDLTGNRLQTVSSSLKATFTSISILHLADNPWHCNCRLLWFKQLSVQRHTRTPVVCLTPQPLSFREVASVPDAELVCFPPKILSCGGPYDVNAGHDVTLTCDVEGDPFPEVEWIAPDGTVIDTSRPGNTTSRRRTVNTTAVTVADFALHNGLWSVTARSAEGNVTSNFKVNVFTTPSTTTTTTTTTTTSTTTPTTPSTTAASTLRTIPLASYRPPVLMTTSAYRPAALTTGVWFYVALAAFGLTALALVSLILVAAFKVRKNQRQVGQDRRHSGISLGSATETDVTVLSKPITGLRARAT